MYLNRKHFGILAVGLLIQTSGYRYAISDAVHDFISFELLSFGLGKALGFIFRDKDKPLKYARNFDHVTAHIKEGLERIFFSQYLTNLRCGV